MARGDLSMPVDCGCKKFTVRVARRNYIGAYLGVFPTTRKFYFLTYRRESPSGIYFMISRNNPGPVLPAEDYTINWSTECSNYGQSSLFEGTPANSTGLIGQDIHLMADAITESGRYVFRKPQIPVGGVLISTVRGSEAWELESFEPNASNRITFIEPAYLFNPDGTHVERGEFVHTFSNEMNEAKMQEVLERDLDTPIPCAYSSAQIAYTQHANAALMDDPALLPTVGGVTSTNDEYQSLPDPGPVQNHINSGHAGRFIVPHLECWLAKALIYWAGQHSVQTHPLRTFFDFGLSAFFPMRPQDLPPALDCQDITIDCPTLRDGYAIEPPETNSVKFWLENYACPGS